MTSRRPPIAAVPGLTLALLAVLAAPVLAQTSTFGQWSTVYSWPNVAIHLSLLPDGKVMSYADDDNPNYNVNGARLAGFTKTYLVDMPVNGAPGTVTYIPNNRTNMFCSGHTMLADGRLLVVGGHLGRDGWGEARTEYFDWRTPDTWWAAADMAWGRWYPSACVLANGDVVVVSGSHDSTVVYSQIPEVWNSSIGTWRQLTGANRAIPYVPFTILAPDGRVFEAGPNPDTRFLDCSGTGSWSAAVNHVLNINRSYASAVQYGDGKILVAGGGDPPTNSCETIDLNAGSPAWTTVGVSAMHFARRQHNLTILPDGSVLATGGTSAAGFNTDDGAVLTAELWNPATGAWSDMAAMAKYRLYHSTALLLPDGRVLSAGSGRPKPTGSLPQVDQLNAEIYSPPYLFKGARPTITSMTTFVNNGSSFTITTPDAANITQVTMIRLGSVTHAFNQSQRFNRLSFSIQTGSLTATVPASANLAPPGYYMLFILNGSGVPSVAKIFQVVGAGAVGVGDEEEGLLDFMALRSANPMHGGTARIAFALSHSEFARLEILDVAGRRVKVVADGYFDAGREQVVAWDGTDEVGQRVKTGLYWYRLTSPSLTRTGKLALLSW
jgi:Galactose oxidase-like, Early set domain